VSGNKAKAGTGTVILLVVAIFVAALAVSIGLQLFNSPGFQGFNKEDASAPVVTHVGEESAAGAGGSGAFNWEKHPVFIIGDSLTEGARKEIAKAVENSTIDSKVGRNMSAGVTILQGWKDSGILPDDAIIVVCLANNITGSTVKDAQTIVEMIRPGQSLIMMTGHGNSNMAPANEFIRSLPNVYSFVTVADWDLTIAQSPNLLGDDGIHIAKNQGNILYAELILRALEAARPR